MMKNKLRNISEILQKIEPQLIKEPELSDVRNILHELGIMNSDFYKSDKWLKLRFEAFLLHGTKCQCCGARTKTNNDVVLHVDHIKPRSKYPELAFSLSNLQILCADCNIGKSNLHETDFRSDR